MPEFNEELLQFIWQHRLLKPLPILTCSGKEVRILDPGQLNRHSGPDFSNGQIKIADTLLVGNIEIHKKSSDWLRHQHNSDAAYNHLILHVVYEHDREIPQNTLHNVEVVELKSLIDDKTFDEYRLLINNYEKLPCARQLKDAGDLQFLNWVDRMTVERLEARVLRIQDYADSFRGDLTQTFYTLLMRNLGFHTNAVPFELLARHLPIHLLLKHSDQLFQLEALVMGSAGLLETHYKDTYLRELQNEFTFLSRKYKLVPLRKEIFKYSRMRPANFPGFRLAQLCQLIHSRSRLFMAPQLFISYEDIQTALNIELSGYWKNHYRPDGAAMEKDLKPGKQSCENLIINTFAPFLFYYGRRFSKEAYCTQALDLLELCEEENNIKTRLFSAKKTQITSAVQSQGLLQLHDSYCTKKACLSCGLGAEILKSKKTQTA